MSFDSVIWEWSDRRGLEHLQFVISPEGIKAEALVVLDAESGVVRFRYSLFAKANGLPQRCAIFVRAGPNNDFEELSFRENAGWTLNGDRLPGLENCLTFDIRDTSFPKSLIARYLSLDVGQSKDIRVAHIDNRSLLVTAQQQNWERLPNAKEGNWHYRCTASGTSSDYFLGQDFLMQNSPRRWRRKL
jgi:hypothetical protein